MTQDIAVIQQGGSSIPEDLHNGSDAGAGKTASIDGETGAPRKRKAIPKPIAKACNECARRKARCPGGLPCLSCEKHGTQCEYTVAQRRGPKVKKRTASEAARDPGHPATEATEQALNLLADLSRNVPLGQNQDGSAGNANAIFQSENSHTLKELPASVPPQPSRMQSYSNASEYRSTSLNVSPHQTVVSLPPIQLSNGPSYPLNDQVHDIHPASPSNFFQSLNLPFPTSVQDVQSSSRTHHPNSGSRLPASTSFAPMQQAQHHQQASASLSNYADYNHQSQDVYSTLSQPFTFDNASFQPSGSASTSRHPFQGNGQGMLPKENAPLNGHKPDLQNMQPSNSPSGGSESAFAQSFYKAEGPGLNHFHTVLSREFNVRDGTSPAAAAGTSSSHPHDPSSIISEVGFSPAGSDVPLPPHMERDLVALADLTSTQQTLFGLYWCFVHVQWPIVYRPAFGFEQAKAYPALFNAMLSVTCRHDVSRQLQHVPGTLKNLPLTSRLGEIYTKRAITYLNMDEMESSLQKVQALFMLALRDVAQGTTSRGWMFSGMATRMAFDLQLHQPSKVFKSTRVNPILQQEQRRSIWCCYVLDKSMSLFLGRPAMMKFNDIETPLPSHWEADEFSYWAEDAKAVIPDRLNQFIGVQARPVSTVLAYIKLCQIIERIMDNVYKPKGGPARAPGSAAVELNNALDEWQDEHTEIFKRAENLPNSTTNLYHLLLWYHTTRLILNRPFIPNNQVISAARGDKSAYSFCTDAADNIVAVVTTLEQTHGIFRCSYNVLFTIFQAGVMHCLISSTARDPLVTAKANESFRQCDQWLESMTETYKCGAQYRHVLGAMERLSRRELRDSVELTEILASRRGSRQTTPIFPDPPNDNTLLSGDLNDNPLSSLHYSFWDMPLHFPLQNNEMDSWMSWEQDYGSLLLDGLT